MNKLNESTSDVYTGQDMDAVSVKESNRKRLDIALKLYDEEIHPMIISQLVWDKNVHKLELTEMYRRLRDGLYGWKWYQSPTEVPLVVEPGALVCAECGCNKIVTRTLQTRSLDEGQTVFAFCTGCKKRWTCTN